MWPSTEPRDIYGEAVMEPDDAVYAAGGDIKTREDLETAVVEEYDTGTYAFESETEQAWIECREGLRS